MADNLAERGAADCGTDPRAKPILREERERFADCSRSNIVTWGKAVSKALYVG